MSRLRPASPAPSMAKSYTSVRRRAATGTRRLDGRRCQPPKSPPRLPGIEYIWYHSHNRWIERSIFESGRTRIAGVLERAGVGSPERITGFRNRSFHRSEEHTSELQSLRHLVCRLLLEKKNTS